MTPIRSRTADLGTFTLPSSLDTMRRRLRAVRFRSVLVPVGFAFVAGGAGCARNSGNGAPPPSSGAGEPGPSAAAATSTAANSLAAAEQAAGWRLLFDGRTTTGWRGYREQRMPNGWQATDGTLSKADATGDIITTEQFGDFELALDWRIARGGNAGIFYRGTEEFEKVYWSAPEYQLLDDANAPDGRSRLTSAASAYGLYPAPAGIVKPAGEWNTTRIIVRGAHVEHWLNGQKVVQYELWSPEWEAKVKASKFNEWPKYGRSKSGHIAIQGDHHGALALRNIKIRTLP
jgi:hypothetical protein